MQFVRRITQVGLALALAVVGLAVPLPPAHAAAAAVPNGISTTDLNAVGMSAPVLANMLAGTGVSVSNVTFTGSKIQAGTIDIVDPAVVSFNHGVIMSSGDIADIAGPNKSEGTTGFIGGAADTDLTNLIKDSQTVNPMTYDAAVLEFDFVPTTNTVYFTYVFGSDEYLEWVNLFNDVFAFFINGTNCASVANPNGPGQLPISINAINDTVNPSMYRNNSYWSPPANPINIESDGLTVELICSASVTPNTTNHMKLAIADTSDQILDSVVMLKAGSLSVLPPESCNDGIDNEDDDLLVDMDDDQCTGTTTPAPPGQSGIGDSAPVGNVAPPAEYSGAPAFTGAEGTPILLDAAALGWVPAPEGLTSVWIVTSKNDPTVTCEIISGNKAPIVNQVVEKAYAVCPAEGEYVAKVESWDIEGGSAWDKDVDFFVQNGPPVVEIDTPVMNSTVDPGLQASVSAFVYDWGTGDTLTCKINWGDGTIEAGALLDGVCSGSHDYSAAGTYLVSVTATDNAGAASADAILITVSASLLLPQSISWGTPVATTAMYGDTFSLSATGGASGNSLDYAASGSCTLSGTTVTMTAGTGDCVITVDQAGNGEYEAAPQETVTVAAETRPLDISADNKSKLHGTSEVPLTYTIDSGSLINGDQLTGSLSRVAGEAVGTYDINQGALDSSTDYTISFTAGVYTITGIAPSITTNPTNQANIVGGSVTFSAAATGTPTPTVKWQELPVGGSWTDIASATSTTISVTPKAGDNGKQYRAVFTNAVGSANSTAATLSVYQITSFTPATAAVGATVTITGTNFTGTTAVRFNGLAAASFSVVSNTSITAVIPAAATSGLVSIVKGALTATSATSLVIGAAPKVTSISPTSGGVGLTVTINGSDFLSVNSVKFTGTASSATFVVLSATQLIVSVPTGAATGVITVSGPLGSANTASFRASTAKVLPTVTAYSVSSTRSGTSATVVLTGTNFAGTSGVTLNGVNLAYQVTAATSISVQIPAAGVASGPIRVTTNGGTSTNTLVFGVLSAATQIDAGTSHTCARIADGTVKCWGLNTNGRLGDGSTTQRTTPTAVTGITNAVSVSAGGSSTCAVLVTGAVGCWGLNTNGQIGDGSTTQRTTSVAVSGITTATSVSVGTSHACAVLSDGTVKCWGLNSNGQLGDGTTTQRTAPVAVTGLTGVVSVSAGSNSTCALTTAGAVKCWGANTNGQLGDGTTTQRTSPVAVVGIDGAAAKASSVSVGTAYACALVIDGTLRCWGLNSNGQLGDGTTTQRTSPVTVKANASTNLTGGTAISAGATHTCAIVGTGLTATGRCWGANTNGRLGTGNTTNALYPVTVVVTLTTGISQISAGGTYTVGLKASALAYLTGVAWGLNTNGQLGDGSTTQRTSPVALSLL